MSSQDGIMFAFALLLFATQQQWSYAWKQENGLKQFMNHGDYDIVYPTRLDSSGSFMSNNLHFANDERSRTKRDVGIEQKSPRLLYSLSHGTQTLTLNVTENDVLIPGDFVVERIGKSTSNADNFMDSSVVTRGTDSPCYFRGHVEGQPGSRVALSTCNGLTGLISIEDGDYFLEPLESPEYRSKQSQPHKLYKRDMSALLDKAEPSLQFEPRPMKSHFDDDELGENLQYESLLNDESKEFCGVLDTKRRYRRIIKKREKWERKTSRSRKRSTSEFLNRKKRSVSVDRMIEMLVVADKTMVDFYESNGHGGIERYILTLINMVSELFKDASIGNSLHISLVRLMLLEDDEKGPEITSHAENTLDNFCKWAKKMNPKSEDHPNHHDVAVLLTRREICSQMNKSCETLGLAHVAGMCQSHRSCSLNQDIGLSVAYTVAHELGHNFAMHHDGQLNDCKKSSRYNHVMASHLTSNRLPMRWSSCSRRYITRFLDRNWGFCLNDKPADHPEFSPPNALPGVLYDADHQCRLMFGDKSSYCHGVHDMCDRLWCHAGGTCRTRLHAAVPGTKCGRNRWCLGGRCVSMRRRPKTIDGEWGKWSVWTQCSRTCGIGVSSSFRHCDNPAPQNGGSYCVGERKRYKTCNKWRCPELDDDRRFRAEQCSAFNSVLYKNRTFAWLPVESTSYPCELNCHTRSGTRYFADRLRDKVVDGTKCFRGSDDICVDGICRRLGCDKNIGSRALEDRCGVCHGNGSDCYEVKKTFSRKKGEEYTPIGIIPTGARNVEVQEIEAVSNFLALRHPTNRTHYYLNGNYMIQWDFQFQLAGTQFTYRRENETRDMITAPGPTDEDLMLMVLFVEENPGISIEYTMPYDINFDPTPKQELPVFTWQVHGWGECSTECGGGHQILVITCNEKIAGKVDEFFCNATTRPSDGRRPCNDQQCPPRWWTSPWDHCSVTCGKRKGSQNREVACVRPVGESDKITLNATECDHLERPQHHRRCHAASRLPCPVWRMGDWEKCSESCGGGVMNRTVECVTYIEDNVIDVGDVGTTLDVEDVDISVISDDLMPDPRKSKRSKKRRENLLPATSGVTTSKPEAFEFDPDLDGYDVEDDAICNQRNRPKTQKQCNMADCQLSTSPSVETIVEVTESYTETQNLNNTTTDSATSTAGKIGEKNSTFEHISTNATSDHTTSPAGILTNSPGSNVVSPTRESLNYTNSLTLTTLIGNYQTNDNSLLPDIKNVPLDGNDVSNISNAVSEPDPDFITESTLPDMDNSLLPDIKNVPLDGDDVSNISNAVSEPDPDFITESTIPDMDVENDSVNNTIIKSIVKPEFEPNITSDSRYPEITEPRNDSSYNRVPLNRKLSSTPGFLTTPIRHNSFLPKSADSNEPGQLQHSSADLVSPPRSRFNPVLSSFEEDEFDVTGDATEPLPTKETIVPRLRNVDLDFDVNIVRKKLMPSESAETHTTSNREIIHNSMTSSTTARSTLPPSKSTWVVGEWSKCSVTCGVGAQIRKVRCSLYDDKLCDENDRPVPAILCNLRPCAKWVYGEWTKCSTLCGTGTRVKTKECADERTGKPLRPHHCRNLPMLPTVKISCHQSKCLKWKMSRWAVCSEPCGPGTQGRRVVCPSDGQCDISLKPQDRKPCFVKPCVKWKALDWNKCSVHCGGGIRRRELICVERDTGLTTNTTFCETSKHPTRIERCNTGQCPVTDYDFSNCHADRLSERFCVLLQKLGRCVQPSLAIQCCVTCKTYNNVRHKDKIS